MASESLLAEARRRRGRRRCTVPTDAGPAAFRIAAVYYDYSSDRGVLMMDRATFERHYGERAAKRRDRVPPRRRRRRRGARAAARGDRRRRTRSSSTPTESLRTEVLRIFDSTFAITYALELIAIVVAILGVSGTLLTLILEREREFAMLRLVGTGPRGRSGAWSSAKRSSSASSARASAWSVGFALSLVLIYVINVQSFGWTIQFHLPVGVPAAVVGADGRRHRARRPLPRATGHCTHDGARYLERLSLRCSRRSLVPGSSSLGGPWFLGVLSGLVRGRCNGEGRHLAPKGPGTPDEPRTKNQALGTTAAFHVLQEYEKRSSSGEDGGNGFTRRHGATETDSLITTSGRTPPRCCILSGDFNMPLLDLLQDFPRLSCLARYDPEPCQNAWRFQRCSPSSRSRSSLAARCILVGAEKPAPASFWFSTRRTPSASFATLKLRSKPPEQPVRRK